MRCLGCDKRGVHFKHKICDECADFGVTPLDIKIKTTNNLILQAERDIITLGKQYKELVKGRREKIKYLKLGLEKLQKEQS